MAYSDFTLLELKEQFSLTDTVGSLFGEVPALEPGDLLTTQLYRALKLPLRNEKAKSELIISPVLPELIDRNNDFFTLYSGENLPADRSLGLTGDGWPLPLDFVINRNTGGFALNMPVLAVIEAKRDNIQGALISARLSCTARRSSIRGWAARFRSITAA